MKKEDNKKKWLLMIAYTIYSVDPRVIREAEAAASGGYSVDFICLRREGESKRETLNNINIIRVGQSKYRGGSNLKYILTYFEFFLRAFFLTSIEYFKKKYKIVHVNNMPDFIVFSAIIPKIFGSKIILDIHDPLANTFITKFNLTNASLLYKLLLAEERLSAKFANLVITVSEPVKNEILVENKIPSNKIAVIANFADGNLFKQISNYNVNGKLNVVFHGTIAERFGLKTVLSAIAKMSNREGIYLEIIGEGDYSEEVKKTISQLNLGDTVLFRNKYFDVKQLPEVLSRFNLGIVSYDLSAATNYMLPLKMLEYISLGLPVIAIRNRAISYYFSEHDLLYYESGNEDQLSDALDSLSKTPDKLFSLRSKVMELRERFLWECEKDKYVDLLNRLLSE